MLDPTVDFLNHGSFGALPRRVAAAQDRARAWIEAHPIERLGRRCRELLRPARERVAAFVGADPEELAFVTNATEGANAVLRSIAFAPGDRILATNHVYNAVRQTARLAARRAGASYEEIPIPLPLEHPERVTERIVDHLDARVRLLVLDHLTSPTAVRLPIERIVAEAEARGVRTLVDGAHAPGMIPLDIQSMRCSYYVANLHKWVCAPKGAAFLVARRAVQGDLHPAVVSHFLDQGFTNEFDWQGTRDITPWICVPDALDFMDDASLGLGWARVMEHNHRLAVWVQEHLHRRWGVSPLARPEELGAMVSVPLPTALQPAEGNAEALEFLQQELYDRHAIEAPLVDWNGTRLVRPCCQVYNRAEQYERLGVAVEAMAIRRRVG